MTIGKLMLKRKKDLKIVKSYRYEHLNLDFQEKENIKTDFLDTGEYILCCGCDESNEMKISRNFRKIYPATNSVKHKYGCPRNNSGNNIYNKAWRIDEETGKTSVSVDFSLNPNKSNKTIKKEVEEEIIEENKKIYLRNNFQSDGKVTVSALIKNLNSQTWKRRAFKGLLFSDKFEFWKAICYGETNLVNLNSSTMVNGIKTKNLKEMLFEPYKANSLNKKESRFAYMYLSSFKDLLNKHYELECEYQNGRGEVSKYRFIVKDELFYNALKIANLNMSSLNKSNFVIGGFVFKNKFNRIEFFELAIIRCSSHGLFAESFKEVEFYNMLSKNNKIFYKPNQPMPGYKNYIPDAVLLEEGIHKEIFIEIFGVNSEEYRKEMLNKITLMDKHLKNTHHLIYWDVLNTSMPTIESINKELEKLKEYN